MSPSRRRQAVRMLQDRLGISERRACRYAGQHRSTQRSAPLVASDDAGLRAALRRALAIFLWKMSVCEDITVEATRPVKDSGRDAFGKMYVGPPGCKTPLDFSLEAKCFKPGKACGVATTARLISRLRSEHRRVRNHLARWAGTRGRNP